MTWTLVLVIINYAAASGAPVTMTVVPHPYTEARCYAAASAFETQSKRDVELRRVMGSTYKIAYCIPSPDAVVR